MPFVVRSVGAYFGTEQDTVVRMVAFRGQSESIAVDIGAAGESWNNRYVEISSPAGDITSISFLPTTPGSLGHFCMDDITIEPVPEPCSLAALALGLAPVAGHVIRRRKRQR